MVAIRQTGWKVEMDFQLNFLSESLDEFVPYASRDGTYIERGSVFCQRC